VRHLDVLIAYRRHDADDLLFLLYLPHLSSDDAMRRRCCSAGECAGNYDARRFPDDADDAPPSFFHE